jgi:hypothetical protein
LQHIDQEGFNVARAWVEPFLAALRGMDVAGALGGVRGALAGGFASPGLSGLSVPTASTTRAAAATISAVGPTTIYQLYVNGQPREVSNSRDVMRELDTMSLFGGSGGVG